MSKIVIALGGNALGKNPSEQLSLLKDVAKIIVDLVKDGNKMVRRWDRLLLLWSMLLMGKLVLR